MSYCIAFSTDGATDVTRRYVRNHTAHGADRNKCPEEVQAHIMAEIKHMRRENITLKDDRKKLLIEDEMEERELRAYVIKSLAAEIGKMMPGQQGQGTGHGMSQGEQRKLEERQSGEREWREARGEAGRARSGDRGEEPLPPLPPRDGR